MISIVIPSYNRSDSMIALLTDLYAQSHDSFEVIVVDDHSLDDSVARITAAFPQTIMLVNEANRGPAITRNRGIRAASGDIIIGLDSDVTVPDRHLLRKVETAFDRYPTVAGLACRLLQTDAHHDDAARWWHPLPMASNADRAFLTYYFSGTAYAFRRTSLLTAGLFPEDLYMHYEEVELAYRVIESGGAILYLPDLSVVHHEGQMSRRSQVQTFYKPRNQVLLAAKFYPWPRAIVYILPRLVSHFLLALRYGHLTAFGRALGSAIEKLPARLRQRHPLQRTTWVRLTQLRAGIYI